MDRKSTRSPLNFEFISNNGKRKVRFNVHVSVNDFSKTHEVPKKTLDEILKEVNRLIVEVGNG